MVVGSNVLVMCVILDLYGQAAEATIVDMCDYSSPDTMHSSLSNTTLYRYVVMRFNQFSNLTEFRYKTLL